MALNEEQRKRKKEYDLAYKKKNIKRIPLDVQSKKYDEIKQASEAVNEKMSQYIKRAIDARLQSGK